MFLQTPTPDTSGYMIAGYVISFVTMGIYVASLFLRNRNLNQDLKTLEEMDKPAAKSAVQKQTKSKPAKKNAKPATKKKVKK